MVLCVGLRSQWGKIKANLVTESVNTPLQDKLGIMTEKVSMMCMMMNKLNMIAQFNDNCFCCGNSAHRCCVDWICRYGGSSSNIHSVCDKYLGPT